MSKVRNLFLIVPVLLLAPAFASAESFKILKGRVVVQCPLTVGGSFEARTESVRGEVSSSAGAVMDGSVSVDLSSLETGIALRDRHMKDNYLEVGKRPGFERAVIDRIQLKDSGGAAQPFTAFMTLHGEQVAVTGTVKVKTERGATRVEAEFPVRLARFQIQSPQYLGVGVADEVRVRVQFDLQRSGDSSEARR